MQTVSIQLPTSANVEVSRAHGIADIATIVDFIPNFNTGSPRWRGCNYYKSASNYCFTEISRTAIIVICAGDLVGSNNQYMTIYYTKATD